MATLVSDRLRCMLAAFMGCWQLQIWTSATGQQALLLAGGRGREHVAAGKHA